jgi:hypothetical protein
MLPVRLFTLFSQLPATPCLRLLLKRESPHLSLPRVIAVLRQAHGRSTEEDFPNECCSKVKFKFVVFEDEQGSTIVQAVSFASMKCGALGHIYTAFAFGSFALLLFCVSCSTPLQLQIGVGVAVRHFHHKNQSVLWTSRCDVCPQVRSSGACDAHM